MTVLVLNPFIRADGGVGVEDVLRVVLLLDLAEPVVVLAVEGFLEILLVRVGLFVIVSYVLHIHGHTGAHQGKNLPRSGTLQIRERWP